MGLIEIKSGTSLRILMAKNNITCKQLADALKVTEQTIKTARTKNGISSTLLQSTCDYFNISASEFFKLGE